MGGYLIGLIFLMFLLAVSYSNNLLLIFTLFLFGLNLIWVIQSHFHLGRLKLQSVNVLDGFSGESVLVEILWKNSPDGPVKWEMQLETTDENVPVTGSVHFESHTRGHAILPRRGIWNFRFLKVRTEMPFGLYQTWVWFPVEVRAYAYPARLKEVPPVHKESDLFDGEDSTLIKGSHDVLNLAPYQGEESRKISWKHYAKSGELVVREGEELSKQLVHFTVMKDIPEKELMLSRMATQMVLCVHQDVMFTLETPSFKADARSGLKHLHECLRELAKC